MANIKIGDQVREYKEGTTYLEIAKEYQDQYPYDIMLVSVTERTREIGIRKSLGARTRDIMVQFLTESAILSACGGILGTMLGGGLVMAGGILMGISTVVRPGVVLLAVGFSAIVGVFFGLYPASKAAKKDPIDALRYE